MSKGAAKVREVMIQLKNVVKKFNDVTVVDNINLEVNKGEIVTLLGASGCGKTTTLKCITGQYIADNGQVFINGVDVTNLPTYKRNIGMVFQNFALFPHMTVTENVAFPLNIRKKCKEERDVLVKNMLALVKLETHANYYPRELSGGQQQRISLARALIYRPMVILFDEPLSNLDAKLREEMRFEIKELQKLLKFTAIYVTHDQDEALALSDKVAIMNKGVIEQYGAPEEIYQKPKTKFVADFIGLSNFIEGEVTRTEKEGFVVFKHGNFCLKLKSEENITYGTKGEILIRPNNIKILPYYVDIKPNQIEGKILKKTYLGDRIDYRVSIFNGIEIRVQTEACFATNEEVVLDIPQDKCIIVI